VERRRTPTGTARRAVLWWAGAFLALQAGLAVSLDTWLEEWRDPNYAARHLRLCRQVARHPGRPVVVAVGSSRMMNGLCPASLPDDGRGPVLVNWGFPGHAPVHVALRVERLLREGPRPDGLVLEVVPSYLTAGWAEPAPVPAPAHRWDDLPGAVRLVPAGVARDWGDARLVPWYAYRGNIMDRLAPAWQPSGQRADAFWRQLDDWGWFGTLATGPSPEARRLAVAQLSPGLRRREAHPEQVRALRHALAACRAEGVAAALLLMPESPEFRTGYGPGVRAGLDGTLRRLCDEFGSGLVDARDWFQTEDVFCDGHHLVPAGARRFTARFAAEVVPQLLHPGSDPRQGVACRDRVAGE
jgi:hypothetical protein